MTRAENYLNRVRRHHAEHVAKCDLCAEGAPCGIALTRQGMLTMGERIEAERAALSSQLDSRVENTPKSSDLGPVSDVGRGVAKDVPADGSRVSSVQGDA